MGEGNNPVFKTQEPEFKSLLAELLGPHRLFVNFRWASAFSSRDKQIKTPTWLHWGREAG